MIVIKPKHKKYISVNCPGKLTEGIIVMVYQVFSNGTNSLSYTLLYHQNFGRV